MPMLRDTAQRRSIRRVFESEQRPLSVTEVHQMARAILPSLGIATVYRTLNALIEENWLQQVDIPGGASYYERTGKPPHHYFQCEGCSRVYNTACVPGNLEHIVSEGFTVHRHDMFLYGVCPACRPA